MNRSKHKNKQLAQRLSGAGQVGGVQRRVGVAATRALAILGENEEVRRAIGRPAILGRGVRILSMDGGGMKVRFTPCHA